MGARLRVVLDQLVHVVDADHASAAVDLTVGLVRTAPTGCAVEAIVPAGAELDLPGIADVRTLGLARRELAASWQLGLAPGVGAGLVHAPSLMAPLVRHDRVHDNDQTTVTLWDLDAWEAPRLLQKKTVAWQRSMLKRAVKHADAVIVPTHESADRLAGIAAFGDRIRVIAGAAPRDFAVPADAVGRRAELSLPERYIVVVGSFDDIADGLRGAIAADADAVVIDASEGQEPRIAELAASLGLPERRVHVRGALKPADRAAVLAAAMVVVGTRASAAWPWRVVEAMTLGTPIVAADGGAHRDVIADGGLLVSSGELADAVASAVGDGGARLRVLAADRSRAFSWDSAAERVWGLHAEL